MSLPLYPGFTESDLYESIHEAYQWPEHVGRVAEQLSDDAIGDHDDKHARHRHPFCAACECRVLGHDPYECPHCTDRARSRVARYFTLHRRIPIDVLPDADSGPSSWEPVDLSAILSGDYVPVEPEVLRRADGVGLLYRGRVNGLHGESESGKSWVTLAATAEVLGTGGTVLYVDWESDEVEVVGRLVAMRVDPVAIAGRFTYVRPTGRPGSLDEAYAELVGAEWDLVVWDGVTASVSAIGLDSVRDEADVERLMRYPRAFRDSPARPAVVLVDHVVKSGESRGRFALGSQHKLAAIDGAAYYVDLDETIARGRRGRLSLHVAKDRPGGVRRHAAPARAHRMQEAAGVVVDSTGVAVVISIECPSLDVVREFRPTGIMEKLSRMLEQSPEPMTQTQLLSTVHGKYETKVAAAAILVREGYAATSPGPRNAVLYRSLRPFRELASIGEAVEPKSATREAVTTTATASLPIGEGGGRRSYGDDVTASGRRSGGGREAVSRSTSDSPDEDMHDDRQESLEGVGP